MTNYKLHYFAWRGCCEGLRLLFHYAKVPFADLQYEMENFDADRDNFPYKQLPVLEIDGKQLAQSHTILRYLSREFGLDGSDKWERAKLDELMELVHDFQAPLREYYGTVFGYGDVSKREEYKQSKFIPAIEKYCPWFENSLEATGSGFFASNGPCGFDFLMAELMDFMQKIDSDVIDKRVKLMEHVKRVHALPELHDYLAKRPAMKHF